MKKATVAVLYLTIMMGMGLISMIYYFISGKGVETFSQLWNIGLFIGVIIILWETRGVWKKSTKIQISKL